MVIPSRGGELSTSYLAVLLLILLCPLFICGTAHPPSTRMYHQLESQPVDLSSPITWLTNTFIVTVFDPLLLYRPYVTIWIKPTRIENFIKIHQTKLALIVLLPLFISVFSIKSLRGKFVAIIFLNRFCWMYVEHFFITIQYFSILVYNRNISRMKFFFKFRYY